MLTHGTLKCDMMEACAATVTHIDEKGFVYCTGHGDQRKAHRRCRKLRPAEIKKLTAGQTISYAPLVAVREHGKRCDKCTRILEPSGSCRAGCDDDTDESPACEACGGELQLLGTLGTRTHYRCRNCGLDSSREHV